LLVIALLCTPTFAEPRTNDRSMAVIRCRWPHHLDSDHIQVGAGLATHMRWDVHVGLRWNEDWMLRFRERFFATEAELVFDFAEGKFQIFNTLFRSELFFMAGGGATRGRDAIGHAGLGLRTYPIVGVRWVALELGLRASYEPRELSRSMDAATMDAARAAMPSTIGHGITTEAFVAMSVLIE
jgi:hypothetical protein